MAHALADTRPRFNSYPTAINTQYAPPSKQYAYHYTPATPASTPTKSHPTSSYPYRHANNPSQSRLAAAPVTQQSSSSSRPVPRSSASVPVPRTAASVPVPAPRSTNPLPAAPEAYSHSRKTSVSRPSQSQPPADAYRSVKREDDRYASRSQSMPQPQQQYTDPAAARQARLIAERDATLKRMETRQRKAQAQTWFEEGQRLAQEAARKQQDEERRRAEEKLRRAAQAQQEEERKLHARKHERGRSQTHNPGEPSADGKKWYQGWFREKSRDGRGRKDDRGSDREQRGERERAKSEGRAREAKDARDRIEKDRARGNMSESAVAGAWVTYEKACAELMDAKPTKGKPLSSNLTFYDIPWPVLGTASSFHDLTTQNIAAFLLSPHHSSGKSRRARLRAAILIWHPDKFAQKVLPRVAESHRPAVVAAVNVVARIVTELISADDK